MDSLKELESFKYYWFNFQDKIYLIHFENNPNFNRVPFLFLLLVPEPNQKFGPNQEMITRF